VIDVFDSKEYWEHRYKTGNNSGSGSYNRLALFKAGIINRFIKTNNITKIIDYGVGDGNQLKLIDTRDIEYTGIDVSSTIIEKCKDMFSKDKTKSFIHTDHIDTVSKGDLLLSCDVIYHLIEDSVYEEYMTNLFAMSEKYVIIYAKNEEINHTQHVKFRKFSTYIDEHLPEWECIEHIKNKYPQKVIGRKNDKTSPSDFYIYQKK
jgi:cyclopropane fatty-acyl-phospholipid synthase-like methyltransferase